MTETRAEKAQRLVDEGRVDLARVELDVTDATVYGEHGRYITTVFANGHYFCTCPWGAHHSYTDDLCAHALAVKLAAERMNEKC